jgi:hypothetical protein
MKKIYFLAISAMFSATFSQHVLAANPETVSVNVTFVDAIAITEVNPLSFGMLDSSMLDTETVIISPDDTVIDSESNRLGGNAEAAEVTVTASEGKAITISVDTISSGTHYTLSDPTCKYDAQSASACTSQSQTSVASGSLLIGMTLTRNSTTMTAGVDNGSFNVNVTYN